MNKKAKKEKNDLAAAAKLLIEVQKERGKTVKIAPRIRCLVCGALKPVSEIPRISDTGVIKNVLSSVCNECGKEVRDFSFLVCAGCKEVIGLIVPHKDKTGFVFKPGEYYHVAECPKCNKDPSMVKSAIIEKILFYKQNNIPYK